MDWPYVTGPGRVSVTLDCMPRRREAQGANQTFWPFAVILTLASLFFFTYFNRFLGLRSGDGEFSGGMALLAGRLPYRDYYTAGPPLNQIKSALELSLFGKTLLVSRLCAVLERLGLAMLLYVWLRRLFSTWASSIAATTTIIVSACDHTDPLASYNHDAILFAILCGLLASRSLDAIRVRTVLLFAAAAGSAAGLSSLTKQTVGLGTAAVVLALGALANAQIRRLSGAFLWRCAYLFGFAVPLALAALYLCHLGVLSSALQMLFVIGPSAKASGPHAFLLRELSVAADNPLWVLPGCIATLLSAGAVWRAVTTGAEPRQEGRADWIVLWLAGAGVILAGELVAMTPIQLVGDVTKAAVYYTLIGTVLLMGAAVSRGLRSRGQDGRNWQVALLAGVSCSVAVTLSLSWPAFEAMTLPGLGLLLAAALDGATRYGRDFISVVISAVTFLGVHDKLVVPFSFDHQTEAPVRFATAHSQQPILRGMRLPAETVDFLDGTATVVAAEASPGTTIFTYPEMGLIYALTDRQPPTFAGSHNIDVVSDTLARDEATRLEHSQPRVLVYAKPSEDDLHSDEVKWRGGHRSGQRDLVATLDRLLQRYDLVNTVLLQPGDTPIRVYAQKSR